MGNLLQRGNCIIFVVLRPLVVVFFCCNHLFLIWCLACKNKFNCFFVENLYKPMIWWKLLTKFLNIFLLLVFTDLPYGGLNQIILHFLFFYFDRFLLVVHIYLYLMFFRHFSYSWKIFFDGVKIESLKSIDHGWWLMVVGLIWCEYSWFLRWVFCKGGMNHWLS